MQSKFELKITCDNDAFADDWKNEVARILREASANVSNGHTVMNLRDYNGNTVGYFHYIPSED